MQVIDENLAGIKLSSLEMPNDGPLYVFYSGDMTMNFTQFIFDELEDRDLSNGVYLVFTSGGGDIACVDSFPLFAKSIGLKGIFVMGQASSAGLGIILRCKDAGIPVYIDRAAHVILHKVANTWMGETRPNGIERVNKDWNKPIDDLWDELNQEVIDMVTPKQQKEYKEGNNVYLLGTQLIEAGVFKSIKEGNCLGVDFPTKQKPKKKKGKKNGK